MKYNWFKKRGWIHLPLNAIGYFILLITLGLNAWFFIVIDLHSHSVSDTLINFFPYGTGFWVFYTWIASNTTEKKQDPDTN